MRALLSVRARRAAGAARRPRGVLRRDRQRRRAAVAACDRGDRAGRARRSTQHAPTPLGALGSADRVAFYQLKTMLQGVVAARHRDVDRAASRPTSAARPAPPTTRTTPGSSASPTTSRSRSGSATTMPTASAARSAAARPAPRSRSRSSSRSCRRPGPSRAEDRAGAAVARRRSRQLVALPIDLRTRRPPDRRQPQRLRRAFPPRPLRARSTRRSTASCRGAGLCLRATRRYGDGDRRRQRRRLGNERQGRGAVRAGAVVARRSAACSSSSRAGASRRRRRGGRTRTAPAAAAPGRPRLSLAQRRSTEMRTIAPRSSCRPGARVSGAPLRRRSSGSRRSPSVTAVAPARDRAADHRLQRPQGRRARRPGTGLVRFEDWERARPLQKQLLALHPGYVEPTVSVTVNGVTKPLQEEAAHVRRGGALRRCRSPPAPIDLRRYATLPFLQKVDPGDQAPAASRPADAMPQKDPEPRLQPPPRPALVRGAGQPSASSRATTLEGKLPIGIRLANKLEEGGKKIAESIDFQSELRVLSAAEAAQPALARLDRARHAGRRRARAEHCSTSTRSCSFGKFLAVFQPHPDRSRQDRRHRLHGARRQVRRAREEEGVRARAGAAQPGPGAGADRQLARSTPAPRSAPACRTTSATASRRSPGFWSGSRAAAELPRGSFAERDVWARPQYIRSYVRSGPH